MTGSAYQIYNGLAPDEMPKGLAIAVQLGAINTEVPFDLVQETSDGILAFVQSIWIDNSQNAGALTVRFPTLGQVLRIKANFQGVYPVYTINPFRMFVQSPTVNALIPMILLNMPQPYASWLSL